MRDHILAEIQRLVRETGKVPGQQVFTRETGIAEHQWRGKFWARWSEALTEGGFTPNDYNSCVDGSRWARRFLSCFAFRGQVHSCVRPVARGTRPLAMMVSVDWIPIKLARYDAR